MSTTNPVKLLNAETARKIAAGEVIDRPNAIVRELMDNAIDSGADKIIVEISGGGIDNIRVVDNGSGMTEEDLKICAQPHATSKIKNETDLLNLSTLGFRGEALASIAAVCRLSIYSGTNKMRASVTENHIIEPASPIIGTVVSAQGLFENFPARRQFLKRPASEALMCKQTFSEKAIPNINCSFRFIQDGEIKLDLPKKQSLQERFAKAMELKEDVSYFNEIDAHSSDNSWSVQIIIGKPGIYRNTKKDIYIFVNGRRIQEYSLVQAVEYGGLGYFPNGNFPVAAVFINVRADLVDFNIHPAKKEVRFKDLSSIHHGISSAIKDFFQDYTTTSMKLSSTNTKQQENELFNPSYLAQKAIYSFNQKSYSPNTKQKIFMGTSSKNFLSQEKQNSWQGFSSKPNFSPKEYEIERTDYSFSMPSAEYKVEKAMNKIINTYEGKKTLKDFHFIGSALGTFLIAEQENTLYIIDKHAVHERMIFDQIMKNLSSHQNLLMPYIIQTESKEDDEYLELIQEELKKIGFTCQNMKNGSWQFTTLQERWHGTEEDLKKALLEKKVEPKDLIYSIAAQTACKAAVKDGTILEDSAAEEIAKGALMLEDPHCPHGRPCYTIITKENLFNLVRRTD